MINKMSDIIEQYNLKLSDEQLSVLSLYVESIKEANSRISLMSKSALENIYNEHIADSVSFNLIDLNEHNINPAFSLVDLGSGGGLPAIPIAIMYPDASICCVDSVGKKTNFLIDVSAKISKKIDVKCDRIENIGRENGYREAFDVVTARALSNLNTLLEYAIPLLKVGGIFVAYKTENEANEIDKTLKACDILGCKMEKIIDYDLDGKDFKRCLIIFKKIKNTPAKYPRNVGIPLKNPLV